MKTICGAICDGCELLINNKCMGCEKTNSCPFGKKCWIFKYNEVGGKERFQELKQELINEFNSLNIPFMPKIDDLYSLHGSFVNLEYTLPNNEKVKFLDDQEIYLGNQVECELNDKDIKKCFGLVANMSFLLVCEYGENGINPKIIVYKRR